MINLVTQTSSNLASTVKPKARIAQSPLDVLQPATSIPCDPVAMVLVTEPSAVGCPLGRNVHLLYTSNSTNWKLALLHVQLLPLMELLATISQEPPEIAPLVD